MIQKTFVKENGITLISIVITIIILLILAGVSIIYLQGDNSIVETATDAQIETELSELQEKLNRYKLDEEANRIGNGDYSGELTNTDLAKEGIIKEVYVKDTGKTIGIIDIEKLGESSELGNNSKNINKSEIESIEELEDVFIIEYGTNDIYYVKGEKNWIRKGEAGISKEKEEAIEKGPIISVTPSTYEGEEGTVDIQIQIEERENALSSKNIYEYYLSSKEDDLEKGEWKEYKEGEKETIGEDITGEYYLYVKEIEDIKGIKSTGGKEVIIDGKIYHRYGPYTFDNGDIFTYRIVYKLNGGEEADNPTIYTNKTKTFTLKEPTRKGYTFIGWTGSNGETPQKEVTIEKGSTGDKEYIANWKDAISPTVTINPNGGTYTMPTEGNARIEAKLTAVDTGSGLDILQYAWSTSNTVEPTSWENFENDGIVSKEDINSPGTYYLWTKVIDQAGNRATSIKTSNGFVVESNTAENSLINIIPSIKEWTKDDVKGSVSYGKNLTENRKAGYGNTLENAINAISENTAITLTATENGYFYAEATDIAGNKVTKSIQISNIDKIAPAVENANVGVGLYSDPTFASGVNGTIVYNNESNGLVTNERVAISGAPSPTSNYGLKITTKGTATPGLGGFGFGTPTSAGKVLITKIIAKIPVGYTINWASNGRGTGAKDDWLTSQEGTGDWKEYIFKLECGLSGTFGSTNYFYIDGIAATSSNPVTWYVSYGQVFDAGNNLYSDPTFTSGVNGISVYNNSSNGLVTNERVAISGAPAPASNYGLKITTKGTATPGLGGFTFKTQTASRKVFVTKIIAKIPKGYTLKWETNGTGDGYSKWLTSQAGTGDWEEYIVKLTCGYSGTFSTTNFFYLDGTAATSSNPVTWYVSYAQVRDITDINFGKNRTVNFNGNDVGSGIVAYGINQSNTTQPDFQEYEQGNNFAITSQEYSTDGKYYIWLKDKVGNVSKPQPFAIDIGYEYVFDKSVLDSGSKNGATVASWGSNYGLSITGTVNNAVIEGSDHPVTTLLRWYKTIDLTKYNYLEFQVRKGGGNGSSQVWIGTNNLIYKVWYPGLSTSWTKVKLDVSKYTGNQILSFVGGYYDKTGATNSNTQYLYIRLYK